MPVFVDTNVFVYATDSTEPEKNRRAAEWLDHLWRSREGRISFQVLHEYYATVTRKLKPGLGADEARARVRDLMTWHPMGTSSALVEASWAVEDRYRLSCWDSLIVAAALAGSCDHILTEDLQHGMDLDGVKVIDPFQVAPGGL